MRNLFLVMQSLNEVLDFLDRGPLPARKKFSGQLDDDEGGLVVTAFQELPLALIHQGTDARHGRLAQLIIGLVAGFSTKLLQRGFEDTGDEIPIFLTEPGAVRPAKHQDDVAGGDLFWKCTSQQLYAAIARRI